MLKKVKGKKLQAAHARFAIIASRYNAEYVDSMLNAARDVLNAAGASEVKVIRVPGAYEIPVVAARLARSKNKPAAIVCLGVILRGETAHAQLIGEAVTTALMSLQVETGIPIVHEVLLLENKQQAVVRCLDKDHNRGTEAAQTAVEMAGIIRNLS